MEDIEDIFKEQIKVLAAEEWRIKIDVKTKNITIVNRHGQELDDSTLGYLMGKLEDYSKTQGEKKYGERRKIPLDEFTKKRLGIEDYVLVKNETSSTGKSIMEVYHDENRIFSIDSFSVSARNNLLYSEFSTYFTIDDAEKILPTLHSFVDKYRKDK